jgi:hypothetical protein
MKDIALIKQHMNALDSTIIDMKHDISDIRTNHLSHIEKNVTKIFTILEERLPKKNGKH